MNDRWRQRLRENVDESSEHRKTPQKLTAGSKNSGRLKEWAGDDTLASEYAAKLMAVMSVKCVCVH